MAAPVDEGVYLQECFQSLVTKCENEMQNSTDDSKHLLDCCMSRCKKIIQTLKDNDSSTDQDDKVVKALREYAQAVLDYTYVDECLLAEEDFPEADCKDRVHEIFCYLDKIEQVVTHCFAEKTLGVVLGTDIMECLFWRRGALLYMYCCTVHKDKARVRNNIQDFKQCLWKGVHHLKNVLSIREPSGATSACTNDHDTLGLLNIGAYSDTHLLSMMYAGDMCYWYLTVDSETQSDTASPTGGHNRGLVEEDISMKESGKEMLNAYLKAVHGPLAGLGWNSQRAEDLMKFFSSL
ncbi:hypothetical protein ScPMuIL_006890 [Solemya velum]